MCVARRNAIYSDTDTIGLAQKPFVAPERAQSICQQQNGFPECLRYIRRSASPCSAHHRTTAVPQARPAPKPLSTTQVAGLDAALGDRLVQGQRDRAGGGVAVAVEVVEDPAARDVQHVDGGVDDADVGLVRDVQVDVARRQAASP